MSKLKTLAELAQELGVTKPTIVNRLKLLGIYDNLAMIANRKMVNEEQEALIIQSFSDFQICDFGESEKSQSGDFGSTATEETHDLSDGYALLVEKQKGLEALYEQAQRMISMLQKELEIKNKQIEDLSTALVAAQQTAQAAQALHAGTIQQLGQSTQNDDQADHQGQTEDRPSSTQNDTTQEAPKGFWAKFRRR